MKGDQSKLQYRVETSQLNKSTTEKNIQFSSFWKSENLLSSQRMSKVIQYKIPLYETQEIPTRKGNLNNTQYIDHEKWLFVLDPRL